MFQLLVFISASWYEILFQASLISVFASLHK